MRFPGLILALLLTLAAHSAYAQNFVVGQGGYGTTACSPNCTSVCADWYVPNMTYGPNGVEDQTLSIWPGIGSLTGSNIVQGGTLLTMLSSNGAVSFNTFWEHYPQAYVIDNSAGAQHAFDQMHACMTCITNCTANNAAMTWNYLVQDVTAGWTFNNNGVNFASCLCDAEVMVEPQGNTNAYTDLPHWGTVRVFNITVNGSAVSWGTSNIYTWNNRIFPSLVGADGQSGNICYGNNTAYTTGKCPVAAWGFGSGGAAGF